jgi:hypothetical protein
MRPVPGSTEEEYLGALTKLQGEFAQAKKILIVGAGAVGVELAGVSSAPCHWTIRLLSNMLAVSEFYCTPCIPCTP